MQAAQQRQVPKARRPDGDRSNRRRDGGPRPVAGWWGTTGGLAVAAAAALAVFVLATPSLLVFPAQALGGERGIFFGVRQYGAGGWIGVQPHSNALFYGRLAVGELGWPAALAGLLGLLALRRRQAVRLAWLLPFPGAYLLLVSAMNMVVRRNLLPVVPALAAVAGVGLAAAWFRLGGRLRGRLPDALRGHRGWRAVALALVVLVLLPPASRSLAASVAMARPSTREQARDWLLRHAPPGAAVLRESYGPDLPPERFAVWRSRFAARFPLAELRRGKVDYLLLTSAAYSRFLDPDAYRAAHHQTYGDWYRQVFAEVPAVAVFAPGRFTWGPVVRIHRLAPRRVWPRSRCTSPPAELFVPDGGMRRPRAVVGFRPGQWTLAKADLAPGSLARRGGGGPDGERRSGRRGPTAGRRCRGRRNGGRRRSGRSRGPAPASRVGRRAVGDRAAAPGRCRGGGRCCPAASSSTSTCRPVLASAACA